jgi:D-glycero-alpha-D-manno-heptose-7-phosphate kinase
MAETKHVVVRAPCRVDLSGGTLDLWPLYLFFAEGLVLNHMALALYAQADIRLEKSTRFSLEVSSAELGVTRHFQSLEEVEKSLLESSEKNPLRWVLRVTAHFMRRWSLTRGCWTVQTSSQVPPGSGLGGSSTLGVALAGAWAKISGHTQEFKEAPWFFQQILRDLESVEIEKPAGEQDYVPALFGGLLSLSLNAGKKEIYKFSSARAQEVAQSMALIYTGKPHHSGINNWSVFTKFLEKDKAIQKGLAGIQKISLEMAKSLRASSQDQWKMQIAEEWKFRQGLGEKVNAPVLQKASRWALKKGAVATKACGSGGGGCLLVVFKNAQQKSKILSEKLPDSSWSWMSADYAKKGVLDAL